MRAFIRATVAATGWILDPAHADELPDLLMRHLPHMSRAAAEAASVELQSADSLLKAGLPIDRAGFQAVLELRAAYGSPPAVLGGAEKYLDLSYYDAAIGI